MRRACWAATPTRSGSGAFRAGSDWAVAREDAHRPQLRQVLREAGHQLRERAAAPLPGAGRRDDAAREAGRDRGQALRADLGLAPQGAAYGGAGERRARRRLAGHGDRHRPAAGIRAGSRRTPRSSAGWRSSTGGEFVHIIDDPDEATGRRGRGLREVVGIGEAVRQAAGGEARSARASATGGSRRTGSSRPAAGRAS